MTEGNDLVLTKAEVFFQRARKVADTRNYDYAIDMYLEGLHCAPDAVEKGHLPLHELAFARQANGGKKTSVVEKVKKHGGKTPLQQMLNAEYLFAKDPDHLPYAEAILNAAVAGDYKKTVAWIADTVFQANTAAKKPSFNTYMLLKDSYESINQLDKAIVSCQCAARVDPENIDADDEIKRLTTDLTIARGKYDTQEDFRKAIKNRHAQEQHQAQQAIVKSDDYRVLAVEAARAEYELVIQTKGIQGQAVLGLARMSLESLTALAEPVKMANIPSTENSDESATGE